MIKWRYARTRVEQSREENASAVVRPQEYQLEYTTMFGSCGTRVFVIGRCE